MKNEYKENEILHFYFTGATLPVRHCFIHGVLQQKNNKNTINKLMEEIVNKIRTGVFKVSNKRRGRSEVWTIFGEIENEDGILVEGFVCCRVCKRIAKFNGKQTSNLNKHKCFKLKSDALPLKKTRAKWKEGHMQEDDHGVKYLLTAENTITTAKSKYKSVSLEAKKKQIVREVRQFPCLWNKSDSYYQSQRKCEAAWSKVASAMIITVSEAKILWEKVKGTQRYWSKKQQKTKSDDKAPEYSVNEEHVETQDLRNELAFLEENCTSNQHQTFSMNGAFRPCTSLSICSDSSSRSELTSSIYSYAYTNKKKKPSEYRTAIEAAHIFSRSISAVLAKQGDHCKKFKHLSTWHCLENLYEQLDETTITDLNFKFISQAYNAIVEKREN